MKATDIVNLIGQLDPRSEFADSAFTVSRDCQQTPNAIALLILEEWSKRSDSSGQKLFRILSSSSLADPEDIRLLTDQGKIRSISRQSWHLEFFSEPFSPSFFLSVEN